MAANTRIFQMPFSDVYPLYLAKVEKKGRTKDEVDQIIFWLTGYDTAGLQAHLESRATFESFFASAPKMNPKRTQITGMICGYRVEEIEDPLMKQIRYLDKLVDELAKGKSMEKILRG